MKIVARREVKADGVSNGNRGNGYMYEYKLDNGQVVSGDEAYQMAMDKQLDGILPSHNGDTKYIRAIGDGDVTNNLDDLPKF